MENRIKNVVNQYAVKSFWFGLIRINTRYDIINESLFHTIRRYLIAVSRFCCRWMDFIQITIVHQEKRSISMYVQQISLILIYSILQSRRRMILWIILYDVNGIIPSQLEIKYSTTISQHQMDSYKYWTLLNILYMFVPTVKNNYVQAYMYFQTYIDVKIT